jgi:hypothetical protein
VFEAALRQGLVWNHDSQWCVFNTGLTRMPPHAAAGPGSSSSDGTGGAAGGGGGGGPEQQQQQHQQGEQQLVFMQRRTWLSTPGGHHLTTPWVASGNVSWRAAPCCAGLCAPRDLAVTTNTPCALRACQRPCSQLAMRVP